MSRYRGIFEKTVREDAEGEFKKLPSKELRKIAYRKQAGLHPSKRCDVRIDALLALQILNTRKKKAQKR